MEEQMLFNCVECKSSWPSKLFYKDIMVVTEQGDRLMRLFKNHGIDISKLKLLYKYTYTHDRRYAVVSIRYPKRLNEQVEKALYELERFMLTFGYPDYEEVCNAIFNSIDEEMALARDSK